MNKEIARVTSWNDCIVIGCRLEDGHEGPHEFTTDPHARAMAAGLAAVEQALAASETRRRKEPTVGGRPVSEVLAEQRLEDARAWQRAEPWNADNNAEVRRLEAPAAIQPAPCHCGQCGPVPPGAKRTPCTGARMAGPEAPRTSAGEGERWNLRDFERWLASRAAEGDKPVNPASIEKIRECLRKGGTMIRPKLAALALAVLLPLLAASSAHAAGAPKAPRQGRSAAGCVKQASGKWAKQTPAGKWSTVACEPEVTMRITDRANGTRDGYEVRYANPERCTVWVAEKRAADPKVIGAAYDACIDTMAEKGGA